MTRNPATKAAKKPARTRLPGLTVRDGYTPHPFDLEYGVRTSGLVAGRHLKSGHSHDKHATAYYGVAPSVLTALIKRWRKTGPSAPMAATTFIDVGSGMGRGVLVASQLPLKAVLGVELHTGLARVARRNIRRWKKDGRTACPIRLIEGDAVDLDLPQGPVVAFLFNPFGAAVLRKLLRAWRKQLAASTASLDILYVNNEQEHVLEVTPGFSRLYKGKIPRSRVDAIADHKIMANQPEGEYASANYEDCSIWRWTG
jgi:SAM-dependent methyltransferase